jgi:hypothetical protein
MLTFVQFTLVSAMAFAVPSLEPSRKSEEPKGTQAEIAGEANLDSLQLSENEKPHQSTQGASWPEPLRNRISLLMGVYYGPYQDLTGEALLLGGVDYVLPINPSEKWHFGILMGKTPNPFLYFSKETYWRNFWKHLKSWNALMLLEFQTDQQLSAVMSMNAYALGIGFNFYLFEPLELSLNLSPLSSRGPAMDLRLVYQLPY